MPELVGLSYSPWSEKARWALEVRHVAYKKRGYLPLIGEPGLRIALRKPTGPITVPVLIDDEGRAIEDSCAIAKWCDERGDGPSLFPAEYASEIDYWVQRSEEGCSAGRALALRRTLEDDEALAEMVPRGIRNALGRAATMVGRIGIKRTLRKYGANRDSDETFRKALESVLDELRAHLAKRGHKAGAATTLLPAFTFADISMTQTFAFISPPSFGLRMGDANRRSFTDPAVADRYSDLVAWRDAIYDRYRPR